LQHLLPQRSGPRLLRLASEEEAQLLLSGLRLRSGSVLPKLQHPLRQPSGPRQLLV
jgi:hypothetical protein